jgi:Uma2 family endonuclease
MNITWYRETFTMALVPTNVTITPETYLQGERTAEVKHEYDNGYVIAMVGASRAHNLIALTVASEIKQHLKGKACRCYMSDMKVRIQTSANDWFYYPDVMVSCDVAPPSEYYEVNPVLIIEVLSPTKASLSHIG